MADFEDDDSSSSGGGGFGGALRQKLGPFQTWVYLVVITIALLAYYLYEKHKAGSSSATAQAQAQPGQVTGAQNVPDYVFQNTTNVTEPPESNTITVNNPPVSPPSQPATPPDNDDHPPVPQTQPNKPAPPHVTTPPPKHQNFTVVTVVPWTKTNTPWNSTLWGIATHYKVKGGYQALATLNGIKDPNIIHPGQKIKVPV